MRIGERVAFYRARRGMTQRMLADLVGRSEDWVSKVERGVRDIRRIDLIVELARALRVELSDLLASRFSSRTTMRMTTSRRFVMPSWHRAGCREPCFAGSTPEP